MDHGVLALLIPVLVLATGLVAVLKMPRQAFLPKGHQGTDPRLDALSEEVNQLRGELASTQERLDFTERLVSGREPGQLPRGNPAAPEGSPP